MVRQRKWAGRNIVDIWFCQKKARHKHSMSHPAKPVRYGRPIQKSSLADCRVPTTMTGTVYCVEIN